MATFSDKEVVRMLFFATEASGLLIVLLTLVHIIAFNGGFGGRANPHEEYNWHVFFMRLGFTFLFGNSLLIFRIAPSCEKQTLKLIHLCLNGSVILCALLGLFFIVDEKSLTEKPHFQSFHSWLGIFTITALILQFCTGAYAYFSNSASQPFKEWLMPWHVKIGISIFLLGSVTTLLYLGHGTTISERLLINVTGALQIIFCFLVLQLLSDRNLKYGNRISS